MNLITDFDTDGFVVLRQAVPTQQAEAWSAAFNALPKRTSTDWNPVNISGPFPEPLASMPKSEALLDMMQQVFGPDIALYNHRFVVKDEHAKGEVFLHQDSGYHVGFMRKASMFVALSEVNVLNGCMKFYPGTHRYGYLGDAGEINGDIFAKQLVISPCMEPGDAVLMNSMLWHSSYPRQGGAERILADIIYQPADDPSGIELLRGEWRCTPQPWLRRQEGIFKRSRVSRLNELQAEADNLRDELRLLTP